MGKKGGKKGVKGNTGPRPAAGSRKNTYEKGDIAKPSNGHKNNKGGSGTSRNDADVSNADEDKASIERLLANSQSLQKGIDEMAGWLKAMKVAEGQGGQLDAGSANTNDPIMASQTEATESDCTESSVPQTFPKKSTFSGSSAGVSSKACGESGYLSMIKGLELKRRVRAVSLFVPYRGSETEIGPLHIRVGDKSHGKKSGKVY
ncbi:hypothetical protein QFC21_006573 [Naganishia friedmannii]|uniref:Uncharacterized protein n=1 Tax=Naganishia friedmannii TaxID=89922 RepID=A0ACC2V1X1_9TREE|nr:hypothetical protein QFC21_006573 [Naganishia friedmannii]